MVRILKKAGNDRITLFIPHGEGRGKFLEPFRLEEQDLSLLSPESLRLLNRNTYKTEAEWLGRPAPPAEQNRLIIISFRADNIDSYEKKGAVAALEEIEA
ncbi:MAG: hypothetical protein J6U42_02495, partial [Lachnospiraceae bacterium]|nr:hypothetical protein [Lachnospiraceae bacterium]